MTGVEKLIEAAEVVLPIIDRDTDAVNALRDAIAPARAEWERMRAVLREHHDWHLRSGTIGLQDGDGGWVEIDNAAEYCDSGLCERTTAVLDGMPDDRGPMPRGGMNAWWWGQAVLLRRWCRQKDAEIDRLRAELAAARAPMVVTDDAKQAVISALAKTTGNPISRDPRFLSGNPIKWCEAWAETAIAALLPHLRPAAMPTEEEVASSIRDNLRYTYSDWASRVQATDASISAAARAILALLRDGGEG